MIEETINEISKKLPMSSGDNLLGFRIDCDALIDNDCFLETEIIENSDPKNMLEIIIKINNKINNIQELTNIIRNLYQSIEYQNYSCHAVIWTNYSLLFRFITVISNNSFFVSGTIKVVGDNYENLFLEYKKGS